VVLFTFYAWLFSVNGIGRNPQPVERHTLAAKMEGPSLNRWPRMMAINVFLLVAGCLLPPVAVILMLMPTLQPVLEANDFDPIWFGILLAVNLEVGLITPPVWLNLYVLRGVAPQVPLSTILLGSLPFVGIMLGFMLLMSVLPGIALWPPRLLVGPSH